MVQVCGRFIQGNPTVIRPGYGAAVVEVDPVGSAHPGEGSYIAGTQCNGLDLGRHWVEQSGRHVIQVHILGLLGEGESA